MAIKTFTTGEVLTAADTNTYLANSGLVLVKGTTIGNAVPNVVLSDCFNSTYDNYQIIVNVDSNSSSGQSIALRMRTAGGVDSVASYTYAFIYANPSTGTVGAAGNASGSSYDYAINFLGTSGGASVINIFAPFLAQTTKFSSGSPRGDLMGSTSGYHSVSTSYPSLNFIVGGGSTMTGGTINVYGYRKA